MRHALLVTTAALGLVGGLTLPAGAADTTTTFTLTAGALGVSAPVSKNLGSGSAGAPVSASLGDVTVSDARGTLLGSWTATAVSSAFTTGGATPNETIAATNVTYASGLETGGSGTAVRVPGQLSAAVAVAIDTAKTAFSATGALGTNSTTWSPTVIVSPPSSAVAGTYTGTVTHSVA
ncbi:MAG: hypothetical protein JWN08_2919 [Frankiales bacterium]|jgi:hypothetical protein|nr:hypothetical protein [Frankiales bacterium]